MIDFSFLLKEEIKEQKKLAKEIEKALKSLKSVVLPSEIFPKLF